MPTPSIAIRIAFPSIETDLSLSSFNKRWLAVKAKAPSLTLEEFCSELNQLSRKRQKSREFVLVIAGNPVSPHSACREMYGSPYIMKDVLRRYLIENPDKTSFESFDDLKSRLKRKGTMTDARINQIKVGDKIYPNAARLFDSIGLTPTIEYRTFAERIRTERERLGIPDSALLNLDEETVLAFAERRSSILPLGRFIERVDEHCKQFQSTLVNGDGEPIAPKKAYREYTKNTFLLRFRCNVCVCSATSDCPQYLKAFSRLCDQGCPTCAEKIRREKRRTSSEEIHNWIEQHPIGLTYVSGLENYVNSRSSRVLVSCHDAGHKFSTTVGELNPKYGRLYACPKCVSRIGETLSVAVAAYLLGYDVSDFQQFREQTPPWLKKEHAGSIDDLRHDGFFPNILPSGLAIALEHDGAHHDNPEAASWKIAPETIEKQRNYDEYKRNAQNDWPFRLVTVPDLALSTKSAEEAASVVLASMVAKVPEVTALQGFKERAICLEDRSFVLNLLRQAGVGLSKVNRLRTELKNEQSQIEVREFDPIASVFTLHCPAHSHEWKVHSRSALSSFDGSRAGTRCQKCAAETRAAARRLSEADLDAIGLRHGLVRAFDYHDYRNNQQLLPWKNSTTCMPVPAVSVMTLQKREKRRQA